LPSGLSEAIWPLLLTQIEVWQEALTGIQTHWPANTHIVVVRRATGQTALPARTGVRRRRRHCGLLRHHDRSHAGGHAGTPGQGPHRPPPPTQHQDPRPDPSQRRAFDAIRRLQDTQRQTSPTGTHPQRLRAPLGVAFALGHPARRARTCPVGHRRVSIPANPAPVQALHINGREAFHGCYPAGEHAAGIDADTPSVLDPAGKDTPLFHQEATDDPEAVGSQYVTQANNTWFDSIWTNNGTEFSL